MALTTDEVRKAYRYALSGDAEAATLVVQDALRRGDWRLVEEMGAVISSGRSLQFDLTHPQMLYRGYREYATLDLVRWRVVLPEGLRVHGLLNLSQSPCKAIPRGSRLGAVLAGESGIEEIGEDVRIEGDAHFGESQLRSIGENLYVGGELYVGGTRGLKLPGSARVMGTLRAPSTYDFELEKGATLGAGLDLMNAVRPVLPEGLTVRGGFLLYGAEDVTLPAGLRVEGNASFRKCTNLVIPEDIRVVGVVRADRGQRLPEALMASCREVIRE